MARSSSTGSLSRVTTFVLIGLVVAAVIGASVWLSLRPVEARAVLGPIAAVLELLRLPDLFGGLARVLFPGLNRVGG